jgi:hypothetical protein
MGLISPNIFDYIELADGFSIVEISEVTFLQEKLFIITHREDSRF